MATIINGSTNTSVWGFRIEVNELSYSVENNTSTVTVEAFFGRPSSASYQQGADATVTVTVAGLSPQTIHYTAPGRVDYAAGQYRSLGYVTFTVPHNEDGKKTISVSATFTQNIVQPTSGGASGSVVLTNIPRYADITLALASLDETSAAVNWKTDYDVSALAYSLDGGSTWQSVTITDSKRGSFSLSGLTANTAYSVTVRVTRADSGKTSTSAPLTVTTLRYPYADIMPDFVIGNYLTIGLFNPKGRTVTVELLAGGSTVATVTTDEESVGGFNGSSAVDALYAAIPSATSGTYSVRVTYGLQVSTKTGGTFTIDPTEAIPTISSASYADVNAAITAITGDNSIIVQGFSTVRYSATASGFKGATISSVSVAVDGATYALSLSGGTWIGGNAAISSGADVPAIFTVTDSRGIQATQTVTVHVAAWSIPSAICDVHRVNNFDTATSVTADARFSSVDGTNAVTITCAYAKSDGSDPGSVTLSDNVPATLNLDNAYSWDVSITVTDLFGGTVTYNYFVAKGIPIAYFDRFLESLGVNCFPGEEHSIELSGFNLRPSVATLKMVSQTTVSAGVSTDLPLDGSEITGTRLTMSNHAVKVGARVAFVAVSGAVNFISSGSGERDVRIIRIRTEGGTTTRTTIARVLYTTSSAKFTVAIPPVLCTAQEDDVFVIYVNDPVSDTVGTSNPALVGAETYMTVETKG